MRVQNAGLLDMTGVSLTELAALEELPPQLRGAAQKAIADVANASEALSAFQSFTS